MKIQAPINNRVGKREDIRFAHQGVFWGGATLYALMALLCLMILMLYGLSTRIPRPTLARAGT